MPSQLTTRLSWVISHGMLEGAYKTHEAIIGLSGLLEDRPGNVEYTTIGWAHKGIAVNLTGKRTDNFVMRTSPNEVLIRGVTQLAAYCCKDTPATPYLKIYTCITRPV